MLLEYTNRHKSYKVKMLTEIKISRKVAKLKWTIMKNTKWKYTTQIQMNADFNEVMQVSFTQFICWRALSCFFLHLLLFVVVGVFLSCYFCFGHTIRRLSVWTSRALTAYWSICDEASYATDIEQKANIGCVIAQTNRTGREQFSIQTKIYTNQQQYIDNEHWKSSV